LSSRQIVLVLSKTDVGTYILGVIQDTSQTRSSWVLRSSYIEGRAVIGTELLLKRYDREKRYKVSSTKAREA
jgi:hypothetical protein